MANFITFSLVTILLAGTIYGLSLPKDNKKDVRIHVDQCLSLIKDLYCPKHELYLIMVCPSFEKFGCDQTQLFLEMLRYGPRDELTWFDYATALLRYYHEKTAPLQWDQKHNIDFCLENAYYKAQERGSSRSAKMYPLFKEKMDRYVACKGAENHLVLMKNTMQLLFTIKSDYIFMDKRWLDGF